MRSPNACRPTIDESRHQEIQTEVDHKTLGYIRKINETQLQILQQLQATRDAPPLSDQPQPAPLMPTPNGARDRLG